jgi:hypothetical protein
MQLMNSSNEATGVGVDAESRSRGMADQYTYWPPAATYPGGPGAMPPAPPTPQMPQFYPAPAPRKRTGGLIAAVLGGAVVVALTAGAVGGFIGNHLASSTSAQSPQPVMALPTAEETHVATVDLCTRFAAGYHAIPDAQNSAADVIPSLTYITQALNDDQAADSTIRNAIAESLKLARDQASKLTKEPARGAIQPATTWTVQAANTADQRVWDLCRAYGS